MKIEIDFKKLKQLCDDVMIRKFKDMKSSFKNIKGIKRNPIIYKVYRKDFGGFETGLTVIEPGSINKEFYMTKGHKHRKARDEIYILIKGKGKLLVEKNKKIRVINLKKNKVYVVPKNSGHRLINIGKGKLEVFTLYSKDATRGYDFKFTKRFFK